MYKLNLHLLKRVTYPLFNGFVLVLLSSIVDGGFVKAIDYETGKQAYLDKDYAEAFKILSPLAEQGDSKAQVTLGVMYDFGHGVEKDPGEALKWYIKAAEQGIPIVQHDVGVKYFQGQGVEQDFLQAAYWWEQSARAGITDSQFNLGLLYYRGIGVETDYPKASTLFSSAANQDHANAQYSLAVMHAFGQGVKKDYKEALRWFRKAADNDVPQAQFNLGVFYENGYGLEKDIITAKKWYSLAADNGLEDASFRLAELNKVPEVAGEDVSEREAAAAAKTSVLTTTPLELPPQKTQQITSDSTASQSGTLREDWLKDQPRSAYTLQLFSLLNEQKVVKFLESNGIADRSACVKVIVKGKTRYNALYGSFRNRTEAQQAIAMLPKTLRDYKPWIRNIGQLQDLLAP